MKLSTVLTMGLATTALAAPARRVLTVDQFKHGVALAGTTFPTHTTTASNSNSLNPHDTTDDPKLFTGPLTKRNTSPGPERLPFKNPVPHKPQHLAHADLERIASPYVQLAQYVSVEAFCKQIEELVKLDGFEYEREELTAKGGCGKIHGLFMEKFAKEVKDSEMGE